jgi:hypothetical protein
MALSFFTLEVLHHLKYCFSRALITSFTSSLEFNFRTLSWQLWQILW